MRANNHRGEQQRKRRPSRLLRQERRRWDDDTKSPRALGCGPCHELGICGGQHTELKGFSCLDECCKSPSTCTAMCPNNPAMFIARHREINGFDLHNVPRAKKLATANLPVYAPHIYHGYRRAGLLEIDTVAVPLHALYKKRDGSPKFASRGELAANLGVHENAKIILVGSGDDAAIEAWWRLGEGRLPLLRMLADHGYELATAPNYSLFTNQLRFDDMHAMKRIAIVQQEFVAAGVSCALHINARTPRDYERWGNYIRERDEITHVAFEFATVWRWPLRRAFHLQHLASLPSYVGRPLHIIMIGGMDALPTLARAYPRLTYVDAVPFMKAVKRQRLAEGNDQSLPSHPNPTRPGEPISPLLVHNVEIARAHANRIVSESCVENAVARNGQMPKSLEKKVSAPNGRSSTQDVAQKLLKRDRQNETEGRR